MNWFRTLPRLVRLLVGVLVLAQFSGVVSSPRLHADPIASAVFSHNGQAVGLEPPPAAHHHNGGDHGASHRDSSNPADTCCALHAYFAGVIPKLMAIETIMFIGERLAVNADDQQIGVPPGRLERPPRPQR